MRLVLVHCCFLQMQPDQILLRSDRPNALSFSACMSRAGKPYILLYTVYDIHTEQYTMYTTHAENQPYIRIFVKIYVYD
jgi:hypothetical protein